MGRSHRRGDCADRFIRLVLAKHEIEQGKIRRAARRKENRMNANARPIDVSHLPDGGFDAHSPLWWGNLWMLVIESVMFAILIASYFYLRMNFHDWPPVQSNTNPPIYNTNPDLGLGTTILALLLASCVPVIWMDRAARKENQTAVKIGLVICFLVGVACVVLRFQEFSSLHFKWNDNAYASTVWLILGMHLMHLIVASAECLFLITFAFRCPMDRSHGLDVTVFAVYWYWVVGVWALLYAIVYFCPRIL
jgi:heme/copper-type cytochrome/quinol oxidase subunit 3